VWCAATVRRKDIGKKKTEFLPPEGMEAKQFEM